MNLFKYHDYSNSGCHDIMLGEIETQEELIKEIKESVNKLAISSILFEEASILAKNHAGNCELIIEIFSSENMKKYNEEDLQEQYYEKSAKLDNQTTEELKELKTEGWGFTQVSKNKFIEMVSKIANDAWEKNYQNTTNIIEEQKETEKLVPYVEDEVPF